METLQQVFEASLCNVFYAEKQTAKLLPKMIKKAASEELADAFRRHVEQVQRKIDRLEKVFDLIGRPAKAKKSDALQCAVQEAESQTKDTKNGALRDAIMIAGAQALEQYKVSHYQTLSDWAQRLGFSGATRLLVQTLHEDRETDERLSAVKAKVLLDSQESGHRKTA